MTAPQTNRNGEIDFWKFIASIFIVLYHSRMFYDPDLFPASMALAVEFFFVVSGFFFASSVYRDDRPFRLRTIGRETGGFILHKIRGFLFYYLVGFGASFLLTAYIERGRILSFGFIRDLLLEFFLLSSLTATECRIIPADWYLSAMLATMLFLYPLFRYKKNLFSACFAPIVGAGGLAFIMLRYGVIAAGGHFLFMTRGLLRAVTSVCIGVAAYRIAELLRKKDLGKLGAAVCSCVSAVSVLGAFALFVLTPKTLQPLAVILSAVFVAISASGKSAFSRLFPVGICKKLGEFSLAIYLGHSAARTALLELANYSDFLRQCFTNGSRQWYGVLIYVVCSAVFAVLMMFSRQWLKSRRTKRKTAL